MRKKNEALIVVDVQNDFCPGGALAVNDGDQIIPQINALLNKFHVKVFTQDWHPQGHSSFATSHAQKSPYETTQMPYGTQVLWPDHCVSGTQGAKFHIDLNVDPADLIIRKGFRTEIDSYSAFFENDKRTTTGLNGYLKERGVEKITLVGLALDFCVAYSAIDGAGLGFEVTVLESACRAIDLDGSLEAARTEMRRENVKLEA